MSYSPRVPAQAAQPASSRLSFSERSTSSQRDRREEEWHVNHTGRRSSSISRADHLSLSQDRATSRTRLLGSIRDASRNRFSGRTEEPTHKLNGEQSPVSSYTTARKWPPASDVRTRLPRILQRFTGYRDPSGSSPFPPLPFPPFSWLNHISLKYEVWLLSTLGAIVSIILIEVVMSTAFSGEGIPLIIASFGAGAVLCFGTIESPLAQPRHVFGGQVISALSAVCVTKLFRLSNNYQLDETTKLGELNQLVWISGAISMGVALLVMQMTGTVHPPGGATALIAATQPSVVLMSWRYIYIVIISSLLMLGWALIINNVGRRRYPHYWFHGTRSFIQPPLPPSDQRLNEVEMEAEEGRSNFDTMLGEVVEEMDDEVEPFEQNEERGRTTMARGGR